MNLLIDPAFAAGFHPLCPYHYVKYGIIILSVLWGTFAVLGIQNKYLKSAITAGVFAIATSPTWFPLLQSRLTAQTVVQETQKACPFHTQADEKPLSPPSETSEPTPQNLLIALVSGGKKDPALYYQLIDVDTLESVTIEIPHKIEAATTLHLHWDPEQKVIWALVSAEEGPIHLYQIDPTEAFCEHITTLEYMAPLGCSARLHNQIFASTGEGGGLTIAKYDSELGSLEQRRLRPDSIEFMQSHAFLCTNKELLLQTEKSVEAVLSDDWILIAQPATDQKTGNQFASILDAERDAYHIIQINKNNDIQLLAETDYPARAIGFVSIPLEK